MLKKAIAMKKFLIVLLIITSCVPSIHPLYHERDLIEDQRLFGNWRNAGEGEFWDGRESWKFEKLPPKQGFLGSKTPDPLSGYLLTITEDSIAAEFVARLLELDNQLFLDIFPKSEYGDIKGIENNWLQMHLFPVHTFARISFENKAMIIEPFDPDFIIDLLEQKKIRISHEKTGNNFILTASTDELQKFVMKFGREKEAYIDPGLFTRM